MRGKISLHYCLRLEPKGKLHMSGSGVHTWLPARRVGVHTWLPATHDQPTRSAGPILLFFCSRCGSLHECSRPISGSAPGGRLRVAKSISESLISLGCVAAGCVRRGPPLGSLVCRCVSPSAISPHILTVSPNTGSLLCADHNSDGKSCTQPRAAPYTGRHTQAS